MRPHANRPLVYIASPYTLPEPVENAHNVIRIADRLQETQFITAYVPHLTLLWQLVCPHEYDWWTDYDLAVLNRCDALLRLPGVSPGADNEVEFAKEREIPVFFHEAELVAWAQGAEV